MKWYEIYKFEIKYRPETYIFLAFLWLFSMVGVDFVFQGVDLGTIKRNAPLIIARTMGVITGFFMIVASMIMGVPVLRDFEHNIASLVFVNPIKKRDYLLGRFLGSFTILLFVFSGIFFGMAIGEFMPWHNPDNYLPFNILPYLKSFVFITLPILFFGASLFFVSGTLSRNLVVVYTQGIIFFVIFMLTKIIENEYLQAIFDPFSLTTLTSHTKSWTIAERGLQSIPFSGVLLYNKLFWIAFGVVILILGYRKFNFNLINGRKPGKKKLPSVDSQADAAYIDKSPEFALRYDLWSKWVQLIRLSYFNFINVCKQPSFWAIVICGMIIIMINSVSLGTIYGVDSYPASYFIVEELQETSLFFFVIILVFYSGELIWKERGAKLDLIYDATPISDFITLASKYLGLLGIYMVLMLCLILSGIIFQTMNGYYNYELQVYFYGFFLEIFPFLALYTLMAFFIQVLTNHKFVGMIVLLVFFIANIAMGLFGFNHDLYLFGGDALGSYSHMNGYGHFLKPFLFIKAYWFLFGLILLIVASLISVRGKETGFIKRWKASRHRISKSIFNMGIITITLFVLLGSYIFYNTNILNDYWTGTEKTEFRAGYEKALKKYEYIPQPKITDVKLNVELYPSSRDYTIKGHYMLVNPYEETIRSVHVQKLIETQVSLDYVRFEGGAELNNKYEQYSYYIYRLKQPLQPGDSIKMEFKQSFTTRGFEESGANTSVVHNGTFFNNKDLPTLGYTRKIELRDEEERADYSLDIRLNKAKRDDPEELLNPRTGSDSNGINLEIVMGTDADQTAIAPGNLLNKWVVGNRNYFHYKTDQPIINFYGIVSAKYEVLKDRWMPSEDSINTPIDLEIYYQKGHEYNLDRMMESMKVSLDYFSTHFSPYQYKQMRIMEFPRYEVFAQSFPNTVPFSEAIGFILDIDDTKDIDMAFYVTAHELAHQWWGLQVEAANVQGQNMILETLAQYSAIMVLKQKYSTEKVQQFLEIQSQNYKEGKAREGEKELPLALVENQEYIYYAKGALNMYTLQEQIGEERVNLALKNFIQDWRSFDNPSKPKRYATTEDLISYFRDVTPDELQYVITDLFEKVETNNTVAAIPAKTE